MLNYQRLPPVIHFWGMKTMTFQKWLERYPHFYPQLCFITSKPFAVAAWPLWFKNYDLWKSDAETEADQRVESMEYPWNIHGISHEITMSNTSIVPPSDIWHPKPSETAPRDRWSCWHWRIWPPSCEPTRGWPRTDSVASFKTLASLSLGRFQEKDMKKCCGFSSYLAHV